MAKRIFFITKLGAYVSSQFIHVAEDLHELCVDIMLILPHRPGHEYTDREVIQLLTAIDTWEMSYYLISEFNPKDNTLIELVKDHPV